MSIIPKTTSNTSKIIVDVLNVDSFSSSTITADGITSNTSITTPYLYARQVFTSDILITKKINTLNTTDNIDLYITNSGIINIGSNYSTSNLNGIVNIPYLYATQAYTSNGLITKKINTLNTTDNIDLFISNSGIINIGGNYSKSNLNGLVNIPYLNSTYFNNIVSSKLLYSDISSNITIDSNVNVKLTTNSTSIGYGASGSVQSPNSVSIGYLCGYSNQGTNSVALGNQSGKYDQGYNSVCIGESCAQTSQGITSVAIGSFSGQVIQGAGCVAIGKNSGRYAQGASSVALGNSAGVNNQHANSIIINATGLTVDSITPSACYIAPIKDISGVILNSIPLYYNTITKEVHSRALTGFMLKSNLIAQTISNNTDTAVLFPDIIRSVGDIGLTYNAGTFTNNTGTTLTLLVNATVTFASNSTGARVSYILHSFNGFVSIMNTPANVGATTSHVLSSVLCLYATEFFVVKVVQTCTTTLDINASSGKPYISIKVIN